VTISDSGSPKPKLVAEVASIEWTSYGWRASNALSAGPILRSGRVALVRIVKLLETHCLSGILKLPVKGVFGAIETVSPHCAELIAACKSPPAVTTIVDGVRMK